MSHNLQLHKKIVFTGGESTAKTTISEQLAQEFGFPHVSEYEREYIEQLNRPYTYEDVITIAEKQRKIEKQWAKTKQPVLFDTDMLTIKIWFLVYDWKQPNWMDDFLQNNKGDLYLLMKPDIPWETDPVRQYENSRDYFFSFFENELKAINANYRIITGVSEERIENCRREVKEFISGR